jgi:GAF domain-containing protein
VGVINLRHRKPRTHTKSETQLMATIGFLVGAEIELALLKSENTGLSKRLGTRKLVQRAEGIVENREAQSARPRTGARRRRTD